MDYDYYFLYLHDGNVSPTSETDSFSHFKPSGDRRVGTKNTRSNTCPGPAKVITEEENPKENKETNQKVSEFRFFWISRAWKKEQDQLSPIIHRVQK